MTFLTMCTPHGWFAYNDDSKEVASEPFLTEAGAKAEAERLELQAWHAAKPKVALAERVEWDLSDPTEALLSIIDKPPAESMTFVKAA